MAYEQRLKDLGIVIPEKNMGKRIVLCKQVSNLWYVSGHGPNEADGSLVMVGAIGRDLTVEQGYHAAQKVGLNLLASLRAYLGTLDRVVDIVKVLGWVQCFDGFVDTPAVMHGFSDLMIQIFGERGRHARSAIGTNALPNNMSVEVECIVRVC